MLSIHIIDVDGIQPQNMKKPTSTSDILDAISTQDEVISSNQDRVGHENTNSLTAGSEGECKIFWQYVANSYIR